MEFCCHESVWKICIFYRELLLTFQTSEEINQRLLQNHLNFHLHRKKVIFSFHIFNDTFLCSLLNFSDGSSSVEQKSDGPSSPAVRSPEPVLPDIRWHYLLFTMKHFFKITCRDPEGFSKQGSGTVLIAPTGLQPRQKFNYTNADNLTCPITGLEQTSVQFISTLTSWRCAWLASWSSIKPLSSAPLFPSASPSWPRFIIFWKESAFTLFWY